jgi:xanthine dehydrogenase YagR molybdenum-binding subunit
MAPLQTKSSSADELKEKEKPPKKRASSGKATAATNSMPRSETRQQKFESGITGAKMTEVQRKVPADEPPPLPPNAELKVIGKRIPRWDGRYKVTGSAKYPSDVQLPGMLYARMITAELPHAKITSVDVSAAKAMPGVKAVYVLDRVIGSAELKDGKEQTKYPVVRYVGQPIAGVAATTPNLALEAARKVKVEYDALPFVLDLDSARKEDAPAVYPGVAVQEGSAGGGGGPTSVPQHGNVRGPAGGDNRAEVEKALQASEVKVDTRYRTQVQTHSALETHGVVTDWKPDGLTVYASTQGTLSVRDELAVIFDLPKSKVRVITEYMGGGFGAKFGAGNFGMVATHLSKLAGAPVKLFYDRKEEHWSAGNRPNADMTVKLGAGRDGMLQAIHYVSYGTAGVGTGAGTAGPAHNMYKCPNVCTEEYDVFTNAGPAAAFRAPGHPQGCFALEQAMDELAEKLSMDPIELRDKNDESDARREERRIGVEMFRWKEKWRKPASDPGPIKRGVGMAQAVWYRIVGMESGCDVRVTRDGSVEAHSAVQDIGGGIKTVIAQVVAEEFGLRPEQIAVKIGDTNSPPGPPSGGSQTTCSITPAVRNAAYKAKLKMLEAVGGSLGVDPNTLKLTDGKLITADNRSFTFKQAAAKLGTEQVSASVMRSPEYGERARMFLGGVQFAEVEVDTETGRVKVNHIVAVHDCGRPMNLLSLESQVNGGVLQGISYALLEDRKLDRNTGIMVNPNLEQYKIVGVREMPKIEVHFIEDYQARSSTDASGIGEPSTIPTSAAIANAFYNATGVRMRQLPMTPARVLVALGKVKSPETAGGAL